MFALRGAAIFCAVSCAALLAPAAHAQQQFKLDGRDQWSQPAEVDPASPQGILQQGRVALASGEAKRAIALMDAWLERFPTSPLRPEALLIRGDGKVALGDEYNALFDYEDIARRYPFSNAFVPALEREFDIAKAYAHGLKKKFFGTFRVVSADDDAQELLIRIQERLPGSALAEKAGMELADFYFRNRDMPLAADAYDLFVKNYPRSSQVDKARLRTIYAYYSGYKGPEFDGKGLAEAAGKLRELQSMQPQLAKQVGAEALLLRIYQSEAEKLLSQANWYWSVSDPISTERVIRRLVKQYPRSAAALQAMRQIDTVLQALPESVRKSAPDYAAIRAQLIAASNQQITDAAAAAKADAKAAAALKDVSQKADASPPNAPPPTATPPAEPAKQPPSGQPAPPTPTP